MDIWFVLVLMALSFGSGFALAWGLARNKRKKENLAPLLGVVFPKEK